jgi:hypothetical protein
MPTRSAARPRPRSRSTVANVSHSWHQTLAALDDNIAVFVQKRFKAAERSWVLLEFTNKAGTVVWQNFNIGTGALGTSSGGSPKNPQIFSLGSGWYQCGFWANSGAGATTPKVCHYLKAPIAWTCMSARSATACSRSRRSSTGAAPSNPVTTTSAAVQPTSPRACRRASRSGLCRPGGGELRQPDAALLALGRAERDEARSSLVSCRSVCCSGRGGIISTARRRIIDLGVRDINPETGRVRRRRASCGQALDLHRAHQERGARHARQDRPRRRRRGRHPLRRRSRCLVARPRAGLDLRQLSPSRARPRDAGLGADLLALDASDATPLGATARQRVLRTFPSGRATQKEKSECC